MVNTLRRVAALIGRDWAREMKGRAKWRLFGFALMLFAPVSLIPSPTLPQAKQPTAGLSAPAPPQWKALEVQKSPYSGHLEDGKLVIKGPTLSKKMRRAVNDITPGITVIGIERVRTPFSLRALLIAFLSVSILTAPIAQSIGGERSEQTLQTLLTSVASEREIALSKIVAWASYGSVVAIFAMVSSVLSGQSSLGLWMLGPPVVCFATTALAFYLVANTSDLVSATTVAIRVLPLVLSGFGALSAFTWFIGHPTIAAGVPIGGALLVSAQVLSGSHLVLALASSAAAFALFVVLFAGRLERPPPPPTSSPWMWITICTLGVWTPLLIPELYAIHGNAPFAHSLVGSFTVIGASAMMLLLAALIIARSNMDFSFLRSSHRLQHAGVAIMGAGMLYMLSYSTLINTPWVDTEVAYVAQRLFQHPETLWALLLTALADGIFFFIALNKLGPWSIALYAIIRTPLTPLFGLIVWAVVWATARITKNPTAGLACYLFYLLFASP